MPDKITKFIRSLDKKTRERLKMRLQQLKANPFDEAQDVRRLQGWGKHAYRLRMGNIRIIYRLSGRRVEIIDIDYRGNVY